MPSKPPQPDDSLSFDQEFQQELDHLAESLVELKQRYSEVYQAETQKPQLKAQVTDLRKAKAALPASQQPTATSELQQLQKQLEDLEIILESRLLKWSSFKEPFWQMIRFGGLGMVLGWFLHYLVHR